MPSQTLKHCKIQSRKDAPKMAILEAPCAQNAPGRSTMHLPEALLPRNPTWESSHFWGLTIHETPIRQNLPFKAFWLQTRAVFLVFKELCLPPFLSGFRKNENPRHQFQTAVNNGGNSSAKIKDSAEIGQTKTEIRKRRRKMRNTRKKLR